ncbi:gustatory receptor for sugar taste 64a-like [Trichoplusia ni]|uniref:Gustatory receptor for sugar taste 64a-like n=1 Tax=Trichoplusia ni TaxID=7111 RepID=A0A7E5VGJ0_TRINI|nr:gustatory receptor for sugar taste 64a-like [Trichoplusia ni]
MYSKEFRKLLRPNNLLLPKQPNHDDFLYVIRKVFHLSSLFGVYGSKSYMNLLWSAVVLGSLLIIEVMAIWKVIKALAGLARDISGNRSVTARLSGTIFYSISILSLILSSKLCYSWRKLSQVWAKVERSVGVNIPADKTLKRRMVCVAGTMMFFSLLEHVLSIASSIGVDCPVPLMLKRYVLVSHGFIFMGQDYSEWFALPLVIISTIASLLWNFQDQLIVLISMGLTSRYHRLNQCLAKICLLEKKQMQSDKRVEAVKVYTWRKLREAYVKQASLVRSMDSALGGIIIFSCSCNFYFICLQLFLVITQGPSSNILTGIYYVVSLLWLCVRVGSVVLAASDVNVHSRIALKYLYSYETHGYNVEVDRLQDQLTKDYIALSGMGFFYLNKTILLQMAGAIITYELVLIQFDDQGNDGLQVNITK